MKKLLITIFVLTFGLTASSYTSIREVPLEGGWSENDRGLRSFVPSKPQVFIEEDIKIYFADLIQDVTITVKDIGGNKVYQSVFSTPYSNYSLEIPKSGYSGVYTIIITSPCYGMLTGTFSAN